MGLIMRNHSMPQIRAFVALLILATAGAPAAEFFVNTTLGNDANPGTTAGAGAKKTIQAGIDAANAGDTVTVAAGIYTENVSVNKASLILRGAQSGIDARSRTLVPANETNLRPAVNGTATLTLIANGITIDGLIIENNTGTAGAYLQPGFSGYQFRNNVLRENVYGMELDSDGTTQTVIEQNLFTNNNVTGGANGNGIYSDQGAHNILIQNNDFINNFNSGVLFTGVPSTRVNDNLIVRNNKMDQCGIGVLMTRVIDGTISGNQMTNGRVAIRLAGYTRDISVTDNLMQNHAFRIIQVATVFDTVDNINITFERNVIQQDVTVQTINRPIFDLTDLGGQNVIRQNMITLSGAYVSPVTTVHGISIQGAGSGDFTIQSNEINGGGIDLPDGTTDSAGVRVDATVPDGVRVLVRNNTITGWVNGVENLSTNAAGGVLVESNNLAGNIPSGLAVKSSVALDAEGNWFGAANGPGITTNPGGSGAAVSGAVDFSPWLANGTDLLPLVANDPTTYGFQVSSTAAISSLAPVMQSAATASPNPAIVGESVLFAVAANDPDGGTTTIAWNFGDSSGGTGATATHAYNVPGVYTATATVTDATGVSTISTTTVTVLSAAVPGVSDSLIILKASINAAVPTKLKDSLSLKGAFVLPAGTTNLSGPLTLTVGTFTQAFTLDAKGKAKAGAASFSHKVKRVSKVLLRESSFSTKAKGNFQAVLEAAGVTQTSTGTVTLPVQIQFAGLIYNGGATLNLKTSTKKYSAKS